MTKISYAVTAKYPNSFEQAVIDITQALQDEGFGILTQINVQETLQKKLNVDFPKYQILGACSPASAYKVLQAEKEMGLLLPCNVIVYEDNNQIMISFMKPTAALTLSNNLVVAEVAKKIEAKLTTALKNAVKP